MEAEYHIPVLAEEAVRGLITRTDGIYVDTTLGGGGYSERILKMLSDSGRLIAFDTDTDAIAFATKRLEAYTNKLTIVRENFGKVREALEAIGISEIDGIVYDLGISSHQLDTTSIGLSYRFDSPLDMRLDKRLAISANDIIATYSETELTRIFRIYGEEPNAKRIAYRIADRRSQAPINSTHELAQIVSQGIREDKKNAVLSRIFQALRIEVNDELGVLRRSLEEAVGILKPKSRIVVISYHSLEDRIVKDFFALESRPPVTPGSVASLKDSVDYSKARLKLITPKPVTASSEEIERNVRSRSAKLRIAEKL
jgi:16S rRNA (cytosine1402-N4)-methyltransferase